MIGTYVMAIRVRDAEGNKVRSPGGRQRMTDDRGVYRLYGLPPGAYVVVANNSSMFSGAAVYNGMSSLYEGEAPTYYPSATRDTATEITVASGSETSGIDIRHRSEHGHAISGKIIGSAEQSGTAVYFAQVTLYNPAGGMVVGYATARASESDNGFAMFGIPDGEYEIEAYVGGLDGDQSLRSELRRVTVRGADVAGLELKLAPLASISGRVVIEPVANACDAKVKRSMEEIILRSRRDEKPAPDSYSSLRPSLSAFSPSEKGEFKMSALIPSRYRLETNLPNENWFVKSITGTSVSSAAAPKQTAPRPASGSPAGTNDLARGGITLKSGEKVSGVTISLADGAAGLRGKVVAAGESAKLPSRLRVHLVPADAAWAEEVLRYAEMQIGNDGEFAFANLAPGKYWLLVRAVSDAESSDRPPQPAAWDPAERAKLRKDAEAAKNEVELKPCQHVKDHVLRF
jgi:hypothetical protein